VSQYEALLSPGTIGPLTVRNRILMTPMGSNLAEADGHCGERIQRYYEARAKGGAGMLIVGVGAITWPVAACNPNQVAVSNDVFLPGLRSLASRVKRFGCRIAMQLQHAGAIAVRDIAAGRPMLVPSIPAEKQGDMLNTLTPEEMAEFVAVYTADGAKISYREATRDDLQQLAENFAAAAERVQRAGFDGVEIHAGHGYIISAFLSPHSNRRNDEYGGPIENRARLLTEVIQAVKQRVGPDFPVWCRLDGSELRIDDGITLDDAVTAAQMAEWAGADAVHVSAYADSSIGGAFTDAPLVHKPCGFVPYAQRIKQVIDIPVIGVGRIEPAEANQLIAQGQMDFVAMGRKLLADPELPRKLLEGRPDDVRPCIYCYTCVGNIFLNRSLCCAVNPATGREQQYALQPTEMPKQILVIGGGPAGMEAARVLTLRGHKVTLCERSSKLGGTLFFSSFVYSENGRLAEYLIRQMEQLEVDIRLNTAVDAPWVRRFRPDAVVVAVGAIRGKPDLPGVDSDHVFSGDELRELLTGEGTQVRQKLSLSQRAMLGLGSVAGVTASADTTRNLSKLWMPIGQRVVVIGGGLVGLEVAEFLADRQRQVTVLEEQGVMGAELALPRRWRILEHLRNKSATLLTGARALRIDAQAVHYDMLDDAVASTAVEQTLAADSVILAVGATANRDLESQLKTLGIPVHAIGDGTGLGYIEGAIKDAMDVALEL